METMKTLLTLIALTVASARWGLAFAPCKALVPHHPLSTTGSPTASCRSNTRSWMATIADDTSQVGEEDTANKKTPIILLAGFLGTGKTTTLKHLLENTDGAKIGVIVNDVASVNIDAKLVSSMPESVGEDFIELQNGCACCSLSDELFASVETLFQPKKKGGILQRRNNKEEGNTRQYDAIVVELSGVADPMAIAATWKAAGSTDRFTGATDKAEISKVVTMIDSCTFGTDYMTWDAALQRPGWVDPFGCEPSAANKKVAELLAEQVEAANLILVNKIDMATKDEVDTASKVARALNKRATLQEVEFGKVSPKEILETGTQGVMISPMESTKEEAKVEEPKSHSHDHDHSCEDPSCTDESHSHSHEHSASSSSSCDDPDCTDTSHSHSHDHVSSDASSSCNDPDCTDTSHSHSHEHSSADAAAACSDPDCSDTSHSHSHEHSSDDAACNDPGCTDPSHSHSHSHSHATSTDNLGIVNFVYRATTPFNTNRLMALLNTWPVPIKDTLDLQLIHDAQNEGGLDTDDDDDTILDSPFLGVLRSKGFCWLAPTMWSGENEDSYRHDTAMYWSHAGKHFGLGANGRWWGSLQMYDGWEKYMTNLFKDNMEEYDRIRREDFVTEEFGDRRQELVFIGSGIDQDAITKALDDCLLTDDEFDTYRQELSDYQDRILAASGGASGLFGEKRGSL